MDRAIVGARRQRVVAMAMVVLIYYGADACRVPGIWIWMMHLHSSSRHKLNGRKGKNYYLLYNQIVDEQTIRSTH